MSAISEHHIDYKPLLQWIGEHKYRNCPGFDANTRLGWALRIAKIEDKAARDMLLELFSEVAYASDRCSEMHREMDTVLVALTKIDAALDAKAKT